MRKILSLDIKFSAMQFFFFASFGALMGYASVYLLSRGISASVIGVALASTSAIAFVCQPFMASFADKNKQIELRYIISAALILAIGLAVVLIMAPDASMFLVCMFVAIGTVLSTIMPLVNTLAFQFEKYGIAINFGVARGVGSAAYAIIAYVVGQLVEKFDAGVVPIVFIGFNLLLTFFVYTFVLPKGVSKEVVVQETNQTTEEVKDDLSFFQFAARYKKLTTFVLGTVFIFFAHTIINNYMILVIEPVGGTEAAMGTAVSLAAMLELPAMFFFDQLREKFSLNKLLKISAIMFVVKHTLTAIAPSMFVIYIAQATQMLAYAILCPASVYLVNEMVDSKDLTKGQSMITMGQSASGIIANLIGGVLIENIGVTPVLYMGAVVTAVGSAIVIYITKHLS